METHTDEQEFSKQKREQYKTHIDIKCVGDKYLKKNFFFFLVLLLRLDHLLLQIPFHMHEHTNAHTHVHTCILALHLRHIQHKNRIRLLLVFLKTTH